MSGMCGGSMIDPMNGKSQKALIHQHTVGRQVLLKKLKLDQQSQSGQADYDEKNVKLFVCGQSMFKMHPLFFDRVVHEILQRDNYSHVILLGGEYRDWDELMANRLRRLFQQPNSQKNNNSINNHSDLPKLSQLKDNNGKIASRVHILPRRKRMHYLKLLASANVALDTYPFGGGVTTLETLSVGTPLVTLPDSKFLRGRFSFHYLHNILGIKEFIVDRETNNINDLLINIQLYVDTLYEIDAKRHSFRKKILRNKYKLFHEKWLEKNEDNWFDFFDWQATNVLKLWRK